MGIVRIGKRKYDSTKLDAEKKAITDSPEIKEMPKKKDVIKDKGRKK